jgi:hypothetical protein
LLEENAIIGEADAREHSLDGPANSLFLADEYDAIPEMNLLSRL